MHLRAVRLGLLCAVTAALSCGDSGAPAGAGTTVDVAASTDTGGAAQPDVVARPDTKTPGEGQDGTTPAEDVGACPGCPLSPCEQNSDCQSEYCIEGPNGLECAQLCAQDCPSGYLCRGVSFGSDPVFMCIYANVQYCVPCNEDKDCAHPLMGSSKAKCLGSDDGSGSYCATPCSDASDCPSGAICEPSPTAAAGSTGFCRPESGECPCSQYAVNVSASTSCEARSELGVCKGERVCTEAGLTACDAKAPAAETCNGVDDDCDGQTDEDVPTAGTPCDGADADQCEDGAWQCGSNGLVCSDGEGSTPETCNGVDDDCDGQTDADDSELAPVPCPLTVGACAGAIAPVATCAGGTWQACDDSVYAALGLGYEPTHEATCDGIDNDCDGKTDEDVPTTGEPCDGPDDDVCQDGTWQCTKEGLVCDDGPAAGLETCNGKDDDCDGLTDGADPDLVLIPCAVTVGACAGALRPPHACVDGDWIPCGSDVYAALDQGYEADTEVTCDGRDNDCDGKTDDDFQVVLPNGAVVTGIGHACGIGACAGGVTSCSTELTISCSTTGNAQPEVCNGKDDDCDGLVDADDPDLVRPSCEIQAGVCGGSTKPAALCVNGAFQACTAATYSAHDASFSAVAELRCDGVDEDCDGNVDEDFTFATAHGTTVSGVGVSCGVGACAGGVTTCRGDGTGLLCTTSSAANTETCNGLDDDCDGLLDAQDDTLQTPECESQLGVCSGSIKPPTLCKAGAWATCTTGVYTDFASDYESGTEVKCDGHDNDCDGHVDEDFQVTLLSGEVIVGAGKACGAGACTDGVTVCDAAGLGLTCSTEAGAGIEICNGVDDDCDSATDRADAGLVLAPCENQVGVCSGALHTRSECVAGVFGDCQPSDYVAANVAYDGAAEARCDGLDNDCDSKTDEDFSVVMPDGATATGVGSACGVGACAGGTVTCAADGQFAQCSTAGLVAQEICNGKDDDCDGLIDAADPSMTLAPCEKQAGVCAGAVHSAALCVQGAWQACGNLVYAALGSGFEAGTEVSCDGKDNDCDSGVDEDFSVTTASGAVITGPGKTCGVGACAGGVTVCQGAGLVCSSAGNTSGEVCNAKDDDCDGATDGADSSLTLVQCERQAGVCAGASKPAALCVDGGWVPCGVSNYLAKSSSYQAGTEASCDGKDNDCDGSTDEDFGFTGLDGVFVAGVGSTCGAGACSGGKSVCTADGKGTRCGSESAASVEVCNTLDDDCDGKIDAADPSLQAVACELQTGVCGALQKPANLCVSGTWQVCDSSEYGLGWQPGAEVSCDGKDNDCDGQIDEDFSMTTLDGAKVTGINATCGTGVCAGGKTACGPSGQDLVCTTSNKAVGEVCDGKDNDCDGKTDATDDTMARPTCEKQAGICSGITKPASLCVAGAWGPCTTPIYVASAPAYKSPTETACDAVDEDCDGTADEDFTLALAGGGTAVGVGATCGQGTCSGGVTLCNLQKNGLVCSTDGGAGSELCDGQDNDCDSLTDAADPSLAPVSCELQAGVCAGAMKPVSLCTAGKWGVCTSVQYVPNSAFYQSGTESSCDNKDNDCDGATDDDFSLTLPNGQTVTGIGKSCGVGTCAGGVTQCNGASGITCSTSSKATLELCDGIDNDCDGLTDAADPTLSLVPCEKTTGVCVGAMKTKDLCVGGSWKLCPAATYATVSGGLYQDGLEKACDAKDNDCDGSIDEDFALVQLNGTTVTGAGVTCGTGACAGSKTTCNVAKTGIVCPNEALAATEICDNKDNDCDGVLDAADATLQRPNCELTAGVCSGAVKPATLCQTGVWVACTAATYGAYSTAYESVETLCDQKDNDCNTQIDVFANPPKNSNQVGACAGTVKRCTTAGFADDYGSVALYGQYEQPSASYLDENCDGIDGTITAGVFVAPSGSVNNVCTQAQPCSTIQQGIAVAVASAGTKKDVYIQGSATAYAGPITLATNVRLYGGYDTAWTRNDKSLSGRNATITGGTQAAGAFGAGEAMTMWARGVTGVILDNLTLKGANASGTGTGGVGRSSYVLHVSASSNVIVQRCAIISGNGAPGADGASGTDATATAAPGGAGGGGASEYNTACDDSNYGGGGGAGTNGSCAGATNGGVGGNGGKMDTNCGAFSLNYNATAGSTGASGGGGAGGGGGGVTCGGGGTGTPGAVGNGAGGAAAASTANVTTDLWVPATGGAGVLGANGGGGGGGGGSGGCDTGTDSYGAGGGGGGAGGCRSTLAGLGGASGGISVGVFVVNSSANVASCAFTQGNGGAGGAGGTAGRGQPGGGGGLAGPASGDSLAGGPGGAGAHGGHSGGGGGGAGGSSFGIFAYPNNVTESGNTTVGGSAGGAGPGGARPAGQADGNAGTAGPAGAVQYFRTCVGTASGC